MGSTSITRYWVHSNGSIIISKSSSVLLLLTSSSSVEIFICGSNSKQLNWVTGLFMEREKHISVLVSNAVRETEDFYQTHFTSKEDNTAFICLTPQHIRQRAHLQSQSPSPTRYPQTSSIKKKRPKNIFQSQPY